MSLEIELLLTPANLYNLIKASGFTSANDITSFEVLPLDVQSRINEAIRNNAKIEDALNLMIKQQAYLEIHLQNPSDPNPLYANYVRFLEDNAVENVEDLIAISKIRQTLVRSVKSEFLISIFSPENVADILLLASYNVDLRVTTTGFESTKWLEASARWSRLGLSPMIPLQYGTLNQMGQNLLKWGIAKKGVDVAPEILARVQFVKNNRSQVIQELNSAGFTKEMAKFWRDFYKTAVRNGTGGNAASPRLKLMEEILKLYP